MLVRNGSPSHWPTEGAHPVALSYHWLDTAERRVTWEGRRSDIGLAPRPGEALQRTAEIETPASPGDYVLEVDLVEEEGSWFAARGGTAARRAVRVIP